MAFIDKLFGKRKSPASTQGKDWILTCPHCDRKYHLGVDAGIMTIEDSIAMMANAGTIISGSLGSSPREDLLFSFEGVAPERLNRLQQEARETVTKVKAGLASGQNRTWYCKHCGVKQGTYPYPA